MTSKLKAREEGFNLGNLGAVQLQEYNALFDPNMRHFFENQKVQKLLYSSGQIDRHGRVINLEKNMSKLHILEKEFREAEKIEDRRMKEEMEMRYRVQRKRFNELEMTRKEEILQKLKADRDLSKEIISTIRASETSNSSRFAGSRNKSGASLQNAGFFITDKDA